MMLFFDAVGKTSASQCRNSLTENGVFLTVRSATKETTENLNLLIKLLQDEKIKPVIDKRFPLEKAAEAHRYVEQGHKKGNVIISVNHSSAK